MSTTTNGDTIITCCEMGCGATTVTSAERMRQINLMLPLPYTVGWMCQKCADVRMGVNVEIGLLVAVQDER